MKRAFPRFLKTVLLLVILSLLDCTGLEPARNRDENVPLTDGPLPAAGDSGTSTDSAGSSPEGSLSITDDTGTSADGTGSSPNDPDSSPEGSLPIAEDSLSTTENSETAPESSGPSTDNTGTPGEVSAEIAAEPAESIISMDIRTSTLTELAAWCRSLGLSEGGTKEDLASRLRSYYNLPQPETGTVSGEKERIVIIEAARSTEYFTLDVVDEEYARLRGDVAVSLKDGEVVHRITAWEILYNRTRNIMSASGGVLYTRQEGETIETFRGESIVVDLDNWSTVFMDGVSEKSLDSNQTTYRFEGTLITRSDEGVTVLTQADISNAVNDEAYWSIHASKLWLLPGSDWAVLFPILKVGEIPVLWLPFFFYPADELIFHPVLGYRSREGNFVQTTTYILGRPKASSSSESSISRILGNGADDEKIREGIFLRSTGKKSRDPNTTRLSVLLDAYTNLGAYVGTEFALPRSSIFGGLDLSLGLGFSRDVYQVTPDYYSPFAQFDGASDWNSSYFFSTPLPFRYRLETNGSLSGGLGSLSWAFPLYSDPFVNRDFLDRSEEMDFASMLKQGASTESSAANTEMLGSYEWRLNGSLSPSITKLSPYIKTLSVSSITSTVSFRTRQSTVLRSNTVSPDRYFFYPDKFTLASINATISGTPLTLGAAAPAAEKPKDEAVEDPLRDIGVPRSPWAESQPQVEQPEGTSRSSDPADKADVNILRPPVLNMNFSTPKTIGPRFTIDYLFTPSGASELQFRSSPLHWVEIEDVNWGDVSSILTTLRLNGSTTFALTEAGYGAYSTSLRFFGTAAWMDYSLLNEEAEEFDTQPELDNVYLRVRDATYFTTSAEFTGAIKPLYWDPVWGASNLQYTLRGLLVKSAFNKSVTDPEWDLEYGAFDKDHLDAHQIAANLSASIRDKVQTLSITADLPPEDVTLGGDATARVWFSETNAKEKILDPFGTPVFQPLYFTETLKFNTNSSVQQYIVYDPELKEFTNLTSSLSFYGFTASYTMLRSRAYSLQETGWFQSTDEETLNPRDIRMAYVQTFKQENLWDKRLSFAVNVNSSLTFDLQRYTYSRFSLTMGLTLGINKFLDISFNTTSENSVFFRYFQNLPFFDLPVELAGENNVFIDLLNSFRFDDETLRNTSGFKLKSLNVALTHHLGDWTAKLGITLNPTLDQELRRYIFKNEVSFIIQWIPITEIKTDIGYKDETFVIK